MKKLFIKTGLLLTLFAIMILSSCKKQIENNLSPKVNNIESSLKSKLNVNVENGIIAFKNFGNYNSTLQKLSHLTDIERTNWANSLSGFISYDSACDEALNALDNATTMDEANNVVKKYEDLLAVSHSNGETYYDFIVYPNIFTNVANKNGIYIVGNYAYRMLGEYILKVDREKINDLCSVHYSNIKNNTVPYEISVEQYCSKSNIIQNKQNIRSNIAPIGPGGGGGGGTIDSYTPKTHDTIVQNENHDPMRIVKLEIFMPKPSTIFTELGAPYAEAYTAYVEARGLKLSIFGAWRPYNTQINIEGTSSGNDFSIETPWGVYQYDIPLCTSSSDTKELQLLNYGIDYKIWNSYPGPEIYLLSAHLKAWTRGTTQNYCAEINYDYNR